MVSQHVVQGNPTEVLPAATFGEALKFLRKRARLTQDELGRAVGYSREQIARLEKGSRLPDLTVLAALFVPALALQREPLVVARLLALAGSARQEAEPTEPPSRVTVTHTVQKRVVISQTVVEPVAPSTLALPSPTLIHRLPAPFLPLIGRQSLVTHGCTLLEGEARLLTLVGAPGVGKSRLALAMGAHLASTFTHGACWVALATAQTEADLSSAMVDALGITVGPGQRVATALTTYLATHSLLLVLDNFEHLLTAAPLIATWLAAAPHLKVLCTSRVALDLYGEYELLVPPLPLPDLAALPAVADLAAIPAVKLFVDRALAVNQAFCLTAENALAVAGLCVALDGLPLAIELAAARSRNLPPQELLQQLITARQHYQPTVDLLTQTKRNIDERHRTLQEAIAWSYRLLSPTAQRVFAELGVFWGGCTLTMAHAITGATSAVLAELEQANLVQSTSQANECAEPRLLLLETIRTFATEQLLATGRLPALQRRHADYFATYAQAIFTRLRSEEQGLWMERARRDHDNLRAALRFALQAALGEIAVAIAGGLWWFWNRLGLLREGSTWLEASLRCPTQEAIQSELHQQQRARALNGAGSLATEQNDFANAMRYHQEGLLLRRALGDQRGVADVLHNIGLVARCQGDYEAAMQHFAESLTLSRQLMPAAAPDVMSYVNIGLTAYEMGNPALARQWLEEAMTYAHNQADQWVTAYSATALAELLLTQGEVTQAEQLATESRHLYEQLGDTLFLPEPLLLLATIAYQRGALAAAHDLCQRVLTAYQAMDDSHGIANVLQVQAWLALAEHPAADPADEKLRHAAALADQARALRASVQRAISPREQADYARLDAALGRPAILLSAISQ